MRADEHRSNGFLISVREPFNPKVSVERFRTDSWLSLDWSRPELGLGLLIETFRDCIEVRLKFLCLLLVRDSRREPPSSFLARLPLEAVLLTLNLAA